MILFSLKCSHGHVFDEWFSNSGAYEAQAQAGELRCPQCGDTQIAKALTAPRLNTGSAQAAPEPAPSCGMGGCGGGMCGMGGGF